MEINGRKERNMEIKASEIDRVRILGLEIDGRKFDLTVIPDGIAIDHKDLIVNLSERVRFEFTNTHNLRFFIEKRHFDDGRIAQTIMIWVFQPNDPTPSTATDNLFDQVSDALNFCETFTPDKLAKRIK